MRLDPETIYRLTYEEAWPALLNALYEQAREGGGNARSPDPSTERAIETFKQTFFARLEDGALPPADAQVCLERLFLLHRGGWLPLEDARFAATCAHLATLHADAGRSAQALAYARCCPSDTRCAAILDEYATPEPPADAPRPVEHAQAERFDVRRTEAAGADHRRPLFRSRQEKTFFRALREVFPTHTPYPNVALSSLVDFEAIEADLTEAERRYFFRGTVDGVLFDPHDGFRPAYFFELDSPRHDDADRQRRDGYKDRILALAGCRLYRIRPRGEAPTRAAFARLLREVVQ